jgi:hypothetical protein
MHKPLILALVLLALSACSSGVSITGTWTSNKIPASGYNSVFVTAVTQNVLARHTVEMYLEDMIQAQGVAVFGSFEIMPTGFKASEADKEEILSKIKTLGSEAILTITLLDQTNQTRYVPGTTAMSTPMSFGYYGRFWSYYNTYNPLMYDTGYYTTDKNYYLEVNVYDAGTEEIVWSSQSESTNPSSLDQFSKAFAESIVAQLKKDKIIVPH